MTAAWQAYRLPYKVLPACGVAICNDAWFALFLAGEQNKTVLGNATDKQGRPLVIQVPGKEVMVPRLDFTILLAPGGTAGFTAVDADAWSVSQRANFLLP